jgi:hypothetical protein
MDQDGHGEVGMPHSGIGGYDMLQGDIAFRARMLRSEITTLQIQNETRMILLESEITTLRLESETRMLQLEGEITTLRIQNETRMLQLENQITMLQHQRSWHGDHNFGIPQINEFRGANTMSPAILPPPAVTIEWPVEVPEITPFGATGLPLDITIDTDASTTLITAACYHKHFLTLPLLRDQTMSVRGIGGAPDTETDSRLIMPITFTVNGQQISVQGEAWIAPTELDCEVRLGRAYLRANEGVLELGSGARPDSIMVQGRKVPVMMQVTRLYRAGGGRGSGADSGRELDRLGGGGGVRVRIIRF